MAVKICKSAVPWRRTGTSRAWGLAQRFSRVETSSSAGSRACSQRPRARQFADHRRAGREGRSAQEFERTANRRTGVWWVPPREDLPSRRFSTVARIKGNIVDAARARFGQGDAPPGRTGHDVGSVSGRRAATLVSRAKSAIAIASVFLPSVAPLGQAWWLVRHTEEAQ